MVSMTRAVKSMALAKESSMNEVVKVGFGPTKEMKVKFTAPVVKKDEEIKPEKDEPKNIKFSMRENLNETAFFYPQLQTDGKGNVSIKFYASREPYYLAFHGIGTR